VHPYENISLARYRVTLKTFKFIPVVLKAHRRANVCAHRKSIKPCNSKKNFLVAFYRGWYVVVHPYSNFSLRCQVAPVQSIKFQTANFPIFCARIIVIFWTTYIAREVFSLVVVGNGKQVLPVLPAINAGNQWLLEVVIDFVSSSVWKQTKCSYKSVRLFSSITSLDSPCNRLRGRDSSAVSTQNSSK